MDNDNQKDNTETASEATLDAQQLSRLNKQLVKFNEMMERIRFQEYIEHFYDPKKMLIKSFLSGMSRGLGMAIGFTVLGAILIQLLTALANNNIPIISKFIADIIKTVEHYL